MTFKKNNHKITKCDYHWIAVTKTIMQHPDRKVIILSYVQHNLLSEELQPLNLHRKIAMSLQAEV